MGKSGRGGARTSRRGKSVPHKQKLVGGVRSGRGGAHPGINQPNIKEIQRKSCRGGCAGDLLASAANPQTVFGRGGRKW